MKDKIWTEHELKRRADIAASAAKEISSSEYPRDVVRRYMPKLIQYEILPNIVWDGETDDDIREYARSKISPPRRLSKAPDFEHHNNKPLIPVFECIMLAIDVELGTPIRTQTEKDQYGKIFDLALSYGRAKKEPFADWFVGSTIDYLIEPKKFIEWAKLMGKDHLSEEWQPTGGAVERGGPRWGEAGRAIKEMRDNPNIGVPKNQEQLYRYILKPENKERFPNCCMKPTELFEWTAVKARIWRERSEAEESITDPLKESSFLT